MELNNLKDTWKRLSSGKELDEEQLRKMLQHRTGSLISRIDRNVRIGFVILFILIVLFVLDDFIFGPQLLRKVEAIVSIPQWLTLLSIFSNILIFSAFLYFVVKYYRVRRICDIQCNLRETLVRIIETLRIYQRLFYFTLFIFALALAVQFISGMYIGMDYDIESKGMPLSEVPLKNWFLVTITGLVVLVVIVGGIYWFMRWGFRRLYGNYIKRLKEALEELDEINM